jgi:nucleotide-binding universal stress UspA family protein
MKKILAATDFTATSWNAVRFAADMALDFDAELIVVHATHIPVVSDVYFDLRKSMEDWKQEDEMEMTKLLDKLQRKYGPDLRVKSRLKIGYGADVIRDMVKRGGVSLVVMGIAQTEKFNEIVFGSTSTDVAGTVSCPVLIVPENATYKHYKNIAFAFDQKQIPLGKGIQTLKEILTTHHSKLNFVNVMDTPFIEGDDTSLKPIMKELKGVELKTHFLPYHTNMMEEAIQDWVRRHKASMLVTVARKHNVLWRMFNERSTKKMAFSSKVPVLVLSDMK